MRLRTIWMPIACRKETVLEESVADKSVTIEDLDSIEALAYGSTT